MRVLPIVALALLAACPSDPKPLTLFLSPDGVETEIKLVDFEPPPF
jgi:hypothetical protein